MRSKFKWIFTLLLAFTMQFSFAQEKTITGVVSDANGPLPGVNVTVKGTKRGVSTGFDGSYSIKASEGETLVYSFMGMKEVTKPVGSSNVINAVLQDGSKVLTEVVVTAFGQKKQKKALGYATQEVKGDDLRSSGNTGNVIASMTGKAAGVQVVNGGNFGGTSNIVIRGMKSIASSNQALIVIDGVPVNNSSQSNVYTAYDGGNTGADINPEDVESMNVLKGAAASALYGERASSGVIVITTKKGKSKKDGSWGISISSETQVGNIDKTTFPKYQDKYGAGYGKYDGLKKIDIDKDGVKDLVVPFGSDASIGPAFDPNLMVYQWDAFDPTSPNFNKKTPWVAAKNTPVSFFETALINSNNISMQKGNAESNILLNYNFYNATGVLPNSNQLKNTLSAKFGYKFNDKLTANVYTSLTFQNTRGRNTTGYNDNIMSSFRQWWQTNVDVQDQKRAFFNSGSQNISWNRKAYNNATPAYWNNPYFERYMNYQSDGRTRFFGYAHLIYNLAKNVNVNARVSNDFWNQVDEARLAKGSIKQNFGLSGQSSDSGYFKGLSNASETNYDLFADFSTGLTEDLKLNGMLGTSYRVNTFSSNYASTEGGLIVPGLYALRNGKDKPLPVAEYESRSDLFSYYAQATLAFKDTYFLEGTYRVDASSNLPKGNNVYDYPSVSGSVVVSNLLPKKDWINLVKVRANYAQVGRTTTPYGIEDTYSIAGLSGNTPILNQRTFKNNPNLKPERSKEVELGLEGKFFNNRLGFDVSAYRTDSFDQILRFDVSSATGYTQKWINAGQLRNEGFEAQVNVVPVKTSNFTWDMTLNWATNRNEVIDLFEGANNYLLGTGFNGVTFNATKGQSFGAIKGTDYIYSPNGDRIVDETTGQYKITPNKDVVIGKMFPDWTASVKNTVSYKNLSLSFLVDGQKGGNIFSPDMYFGTQTGLYPETVALRDPNYVVPGVILKNGEYVTNNVPFAADNTPDELADITAAANYANKEFIYDASFIKLREASISYNLPKKLFNDKLDVTLSAFGRNLWIIYKDLPYADPESTITSGAGASNAASVNSGNLARGYSIGAMPTTRIIGASVNLKF